MFEISWSELLILGIVTLVFVGPKELPVFLRTLGRYAGSIRRQANEFRAQFDDAMREAELDSMKKEFADMQASVNAEVMKGTAGLDTAIAPPGAALASQAGGSPSSGSHTGASHTGASLTSSGATGSGEAGMTQAGVQLPSRAVANVVASADAKPLPMPPMPAPPGMGT